MIVYRNLMKKIDDLQAKLTTLEAERDGLREERDAIVELAQAFCSRSVVDYVAELHKKNHTLRTELSTLRAAAEGAKLEASLSRVCTAEEAHDALARVRIQLATAPRGMS